MKDLGNARNLFSGLTIPYVVLAGVLSFFVLRYAEVPYFWIAMAWSPVLLVAARTARGGWAKTLLSNVFVLTFLIGFVELAYNDTPEVTRTTSSGSSYKPFVSRHPILGYKLNPDNLVHRIEQYSTGDRVDVVYTINKNGLRATGPSGVIDDSSTQSIIFFGGSFTFGDAIADTETLPYDVGRNLDWKYRVYNFGVSGFGPHQMLAALENGLVSDVVAEPPKFIVYQAIAGHIDRVIHGNPWMRAGPRYQLVDGRPVYMGQFDYSTNIIQNQLMKSFIYKRLAAYLEKRIRSEEAQRLFVEIVKEARDQTAALYPGSKFLMVIWGTNPWFEVEYDTHGVVRQLRDAGIDVYEVKDIIDEDFGPNSKFRVPGNGHPNGLAYQRIADFLTANVLG